MITINSQLDMTPGAIPVVIHRSQYDSDFSIVFTLFARTGNFTIASGTTAKVRGTKKSGTGYSADATIDVSAKTVTVTGDQQMTVASGQNIFEIVLMSGTKELCSANFILDVERAALDMDTITDDTVIRELDNLDQFITEAEAAADRAEDAAATFSVDPTLTVSGKAADAKTVGDAIASEDKKALAAFATDTASGAVANFPDGADSIPMKDVLIHIEPVQAGSGDPSPDNVRPITGWTGCVISHSGADMTNPTTYSITFPSSAGTVYGGTLDVTSGVLTVDRAMVDLGTLTWNYSGENSNHRFSANMPPNYKKPSSAADRANIVCSSYASNPDVVSAVNALGISGYQNANSVFVRDLAYSDVSTFITAMSGVQCVYSLATPITYNLTPQEITSLLGTNNLWADTGDSDVEYRSDTKVYVDAKVAAAESNITALQNSKVDKTTPLLNFDDTAADPLTDDGALANALRDLGILGTVALNGVLYIKKVLTELCERVVTKKATITPSHRTGQIFFRKMGDFVVCWSPSDFTSLAAGEYVELATIPTGYRPTTNVTVAVQNNRNRAIVVMFSPTGALRAYNYSTAITTNDSGAFFAAWSTV